MENNEFHSLTSLNISLKGLCVLERVDMQGSVEILVWFYRDPEKSEIIAFHQTRPPELKTEE